MSATGTDDQLLARRAAELAKPIQDEAEVGRIDLLVLVVADQQVAVPLRDVRGVRPPGPVTWVPGSGAGLAGVVGGPGEVLPVAALGGLLGLVPALPQEQQWVVSLDDPAAPLGLLTDAVVDITAVHPEELSAPADTASLVAALLPDGTAVLDTPRLLADPRVSSATPDPTEEPSWRDR